jgi:HAE1 family hydrophobic/amphiphilic exporter-1
MSNYSVKKPITVLMGVLIIIVLGLFSITRLPLTLFPEVNLPFVVTITSYPGASPEDIESTVSDPLEAAVSTIGNFATVTSQSNENFAISFVTFQDGTNLDSVTVELREIINNLTFPDGVGNTTILRLSPDLLPVMNVTMYRSFDDTVSDDEALILNTEWINRDILNELKSIPGVADVTLTGAADIVLEVNLDEATLETLGLTQDEVLTTLNEQNTEGLVGAVIDEGVIRLLYLGNAPQTLEQLKNIPIYFLDGVTYTLNDVSTSVEFVNNATQSYSKVNGRQGIQISFQKQSDVGITEVTSRILSKLDTLIEDSPYDASYDVLFDQGAFINDSINSVFVNLLIGGLLAVGVLFVFLRDIKPTIIVGLAIPISVVAAFLLMFLSNISLNIISMGGLALAIGMLVDNSVVVIENIYRLLAEGKSKIEAAVLGSKEVGGAIAASTITTAAVFLPIFFIEGLVADIFIPMALTIVYALGASLVIALSMVPSMASRFLNDLVIKDESKASKKFKSAYKHSVLFSIKYKWLTFLIIVVLLIGSSAIVFSRGFILIPPTDEGTVSVNINFAGDLEFEDKTAFADQLTFDLLALRDVDSVSATLGGGFVFGPPQAQGSGETLSMTVTLLESRTKSTQENAFAIEAFILKYNFKDLENISATNLLEVSVSTQDSSAGAFGPTGITAKISGFDLLTLEKIANDLVEIMNGIEGVEDPDNGINVGADRIFIEVDQAEAIKLGLTNQDVIDNFSLAFSLLGNLGTTETLDVFIDGVTYTVDVPTDAALGLSLDVFGDYEQFLGGVMLFSDDLRALIDSSYDEALYGPLYVPNFLLPNYVVGTPVQLIVNPGVFVTLDENLKPTSFTAFDPLNPTAATPLSSLGISVYEEDSVVTISKVTGFATIFTDGNSRYLEVTAGIADGFNVTLVSEDVVDAVNTYLESETFLSYGGGYTVTFAGENEEIQSLFLDLALGLIVAILIVYMVMAIQFQSLKYPLIILGTIPLAFTGGMIALLVTGSNLSLVALVGFVLLVGIVVNNGIVLIDYMNQLREQGYGVMDAIITAGETRLRPIFMTALTTVISLFILALGVGEGSELLQPLAITAIGGLLYATLLTLLVVPTIYAMFNRKQIKDEAK